MPRLPITISIAPSRLAFAVHLGVALAIWLVLARYAPAWLTVMAAVLLGAGLAWQWCQARPWQLRWVSQTGTAGRWQTRKEDVAPWCDATLEIEYLGPWLAAVIVNGRRYWLWPDSAPRHLLRDLRRALVVQRGRRSGA